MGKIDKNKKKCEKDKKVFEEKKENIDVKSDNSHFINKSNAINMVSDYASALNVWQNVIKNILPSNSINIMSETLFNVKDILPQNDIKIMSEMLFKVKDILPSNSINIMSETLFNVKDILPRNDIKIMSEMLLHSNYKIDRILNQIKNPIIESKISKKVLSSFTENVMPQKYISDILNNINTYYRDAFEICMNEILNSRINLTNLYINNNWIESLDLEEIEKFSEEDKNETIENVKEIVNLSKAKTENVEQKLYKKIEKIKKEHPISFNMIKVIIEIVILPTIVSLLCNQNANEYNNNTQIVMIENLNQDLIENVRYVVAKKLNLRSGAGKEYDVIAVLEYGTVVNVKEKIKYWTKIEYRNPNSDINIEGWVYTRYLEEFDIELLKK